jgi:hypothetical protein
MANQYTKLFINNTEIDLFTDERGTPQLPLNVNRLVNDLKGSVRGDYSRVSITVPATKINISVLGKSKAFKPFRIQVDGQPDFNGTAQVRRIQNQSNSYADIDYKYEINLISNNSSWQVLLGNTYLSELTTEAVDWNGANVAAGFLSEPNVRNWAFALIKWKQWENSKGTGTDFHFMPSVTETTPLLYIRPLIHAAFNSIGYTLNSEYLDTDEGSKLVIDTPLFDKMPNSFNDQYLNTSVSLSAPVTFTGAENKLPCDVVDSFAPNNPTAYNTTSFQYTAPLTGYYTVDVEVLFNAIAPPTPQYSFIVLLQVNGVVAVPSIGFGYTNVGSGAVPYPAGVRARGNMGVVFANAGDTISYFMNSSPSLTIDEAKMTFTGEAVREFGMPIDFKYLLGKLKALDLILGLKVVKNLCFQTDEDSKTVTIEPKDGYINTARIGNVSETKEGFYKEQQKDYTQLVDYSKPSNTEYPEFEAVNIFKYKSDSDPTIEWVEGENELAIYEARFNLGEDFTQSTEKTIEVPFFAKTIHVTDFQAKYPNTDIDPQFPLIYNQNYVLDPTAIEADYNKTVRLFYHAGQRFGDLEGVDGYIELNEAQGLQTRVPATFMVNYNDTTGLDPNLGFNTEIINGIKSMGQLEKCYLRELKRKKDGELYNAYIKFNSIDNRNFSFRIKAYKNGQKYVVQELKGYNPLVDSPTQFYFFLDVYPTQEDVNNIQNNSLLSIVSLLTTN